MAKIKADDESPEAAPAKAAEKKSPEQVLAELYPGYVELRTVPTLAEVEGLKSKGYEVLGKRRLDDGRGSEWHLGKKGKS